MSGYELWHHIKRQFPEITDKEIGEYAGTTGSNVSQWKHPGKRPSFDHVKALAKNIQTHPGYILAWGLDEHNLMRLAGYEIAASPSAAREAAAEKRFMADWAEVTGQIAQLGSKRRQEVLEAVRKVLKP